VVFLVEDNGYAISVPVREADRRRQYRRVGGAFPSLHVEEVDAPDSHRFLRPCGGWVDWCRARHGPRPGFAPRFIRPYSHSLSDVERL